MSIQSVYILISIVTVIFTAGAAFGGVKYALNGTKEDFKEMKDNQTQIKLDQKIFEERIFVKFDLVQQQISDNKDKIHNQKAVCDERVKIIDKLANKI